MQVVELPDEMVSEINQIVKDCPEYGYEGTAEFVREAVRAHLHKYW